MKKCSKCGVEKPRTVEYFAKQKDGRDGFCASCKECRKNYMKKYWQLNDYKKEEYVENNKEKIAEYGKKYREENKEEIKERKSEWRKENAENIRIAKQKRKANKQRLEATLTVEQWDKTKFDFNNSCAYCGITEEEHLEVHKERLHQDHFIALNGKGEYTHNNIIPSCRKCNSSKHTRDFFKWYPSCKHYDKKREKFILEYLNYIDDTQQLALL